MRIALVQCPSWTVESPPYALGVLAAVLRKAGYETKSFDFNIKAYRYCGSLGPNVSGAVTRESWGMDSRGNVWYEKDAVTAFLKSAPGLISDMMDEVAAFEPQVIGFSVQSTSKFFSLAIAEKLKEKRKDIPVIFGGPLVFKNCYGPDILKDYPFLDAISFTESDLTLPGFLDFFHQNGSMQATPGFAVRLASGEISVGKEPEPVLDLDKLPFGDYSDFPLENYAKKLIPIATSRGCINRCSFCSESPQWRRYRRRSAENIAEEMALQLARYPNVSDFWFNDSLINGDMVMLDRLCDLIISRGMKIRWGGQGLICEEMDVSFLRKMKAAGCYRISYGLESGSDAILKLMRKGYTVSLAERVIRDTYDIGIDTIFNIIVGFPGEDEARFQETKEFVRRCRRYASHIEMPLYLLLKGSYVFNHLDEFNIHPINFEEDWQLCWRTKDNTSTYPIRAKRLTELRALLNVP